MFYDKIPLGGNLNIRVYKLINKKKVLIDRFSDHNMIVNTGKQLLTYLLAGEPGNHKITKVGVGENTTAPDETDTAPLLNQFIKPVEGYNFLADNIVQFQIEFNTGEANGLNIAEFGLFSESEVLFARKTRIPAIPKDGDVIIEGDWTIFLFECKIVKFSSNSNIIFNTNSSIYQ